MSFKKMQYNLIFTDLSLFSSMEKNVTLPNKNTADENVVHKFKKTI